MVDTFWHLNRSNGLTQYTRGHLTVTMVEPGAWQWQCARCGQESSGCPTRMHARDAAARHARDNCP